MERDVAVFAAVFLFFAVVVGTLVMVVQPAAPVAISFDVPWAPKETLYVGSGPQLPQTVNW